MARTKKRGELFANITDVAFFLDATGTFGSSTLANIEAKGQTTHTLASAANFGDGDYYRVGADEDVEVMHQTGAAAGADITSRWGLGRDHASGEAVVEQTRTTLGHIGDSGFRLTNASDIEVIYSAIRRQVLSQIVSHIDSTFEVQLEGYNLENLCLLYGIAESNITGSGTAAAPHALFLDGSVSEVSNLSLEMNGVRKDGLIERVHLLGVEMDPGSLNLEFARKMAPITIRGRATSGIRFLQNS